MGKYADYNDNSQMQSNVNKNSASVGRTSMVSKLSKDTSKAQYDRLGQSASVDSRGMTAKSGNIGSYDICDNERRSISSNQRTSGINETLKTQNGNMKEQFSKTSGYSTNPD